MPGIALKKNIPDKKLLLRLASGITLSNLLLILFLPTNEKKEASALLNPNIPGDYVEMSVQAQFLTPFKEQKKINMLDKNKNLICRQAILRELSQEEDYMGRSQSKTIVAVSSSCVSKLIHKTEVFIIPQGNYKKIERQKNRRSYEIYY